MKYDVNKAAMILSVGELCELALSGGDLDLRPGHTARFSPARAKLGADIHRKLQSEGGALYTPEVSFTHTTLHHGISFEVSGRADGILYQHPPMVDEIKSISARAFEYPPSPYHTAQAKCYAYFLSRERALAEVDVRLTYVRVDDGGIRHITTRCTKEKLEAFYLDLLSRIEYRARILCEHETILRPSAAAAHFPYSSVREGQEILIKECYRDIRAGKRLFAEAPTGIGKTVSTLYPAVRALGEGHCDRIFYLTAKAATRREAFMAAGKIFEGGARLRTVVLTARDQLCTNEGARSDPAGISRHCNPADCPRARGFYDRCPNAICDLLSHQNGFSRQTVEETASRYSICPYEFQLELSEFCDIIICDYNYVFDPQVYLRRYFSPEENLGGKNVLLVDEAHNLGDRARSMYSAAISSTDVASIWRLLPEHEPLKETIEKLSVTMVGLRRLCRESLQKDENGIEHGYYLNHGPLTDLCETVTVTQKKLEAWLRTHSGDPNEVAVYSFSSKLKRFDVIAEYFDRSFLTFVELSGEDRTVRLICLDPSRVLDARMSAAHAAVLFSATLTPPDYFADILGGGKGAVRISLPSPFDPENLCLAAVTGISTRYEDREKSYGRLVTVIAAAVSAKHGNYIVYFPSYDYMEKVAERFAAKYPTVPVIRQSRGMNASEKEHFLEQFADDNRLRVGFCVLGGSFSEGVDLPGRRLIGTVIIGTGLPGISNERNILSEHYEATRERGYDYAYLYPGMNRVAQAAGRVIRREDDRGVVVLVDDRYADPRLRGIFPEHWNGMKYAGNAGELAEIVRAFWKKFK